MYLSYLRRFKIRLARLFSRSATLCLSHLRHQENWNISTTLSSISSRTVPPPIIPVIQNKIIACFSHSYTWSFLSGLCSQSGVRCSKLYFHATLHRTKAKTRSRHMVPTTWHAVPAMWPIWWRLRRTWCRLRNTCRYISMLLYNWCVCACTQIARLRL